jgi:hypothetical protein
MVIVMAAAAVPVETPAVIPAISRAPVIHRHRTGTGNGRRLGGTRRHAQSGQPQPAGHQRCGRYL